jgi:hypothetical protein
VKGEKVEFELRKDEIEMPIDGKELYDIPVKLSCKHITETLFRNIKDIWRQVSCEEHCMYRKIVFNGDEIIIKNTTIEEYKKYHEKQLEKTIKIAREKTLQDAKNNEYQELLKAKKEQQFKDKIRDA